MRIDIRVCLFRQADRQTDRLTHTHTQTGRQTETGGQGCQGYIYKAGTQQGVR
jgi:hypothetical protein